MAYTDTVEYIDPPKFSGNICKQPKLHKRTIIDADSPVYSRANRNFDQRQYLYPAPPIFLGPTQIRYPKEPCFILRLPIKIPGTDWRLPVELDWLAKFVEDCASYQQNFDDFLNRYFYLTVRSGPVSSQNDERFHVDGFQGALVPRHLPEQNYLWTSTDPTLFAIQPYFCEDLDPAKHNIHDFFDRHTDRRQVWSGLPGGVYLFDPYHVHARPAVVGWRTVERLTALTVEIRDDTNTRNPALQMPAYGKPDPRNHLWPFPFATPELKFGLKKEAK